MRILSRLLATEQAGPLLLGTCALIAMLLANSPLGPAYLSFWQITLAGLSLEHWVNDALMAIFFLYVGLELEREFYTGELASLRQAMLPVIAALGGILVPAGMHYLLNAGTPTQAGAGIPMATDIAFALGALALLGSRIPVSLKVFLTALAVMDDLGAILVIAFFYSTKFSLPYLLASLAVFLVLVAANRRRVTALWPYLLGGVLMWFLMLKSGVHATVAGVLLAFAVPFTVHAPGEVTPSEKLEHALHAPVSLLILPVFALANAGVVFAADWTQGLLSANGLGILAGLVIGKPLGITLFSYFAVTMGWCRLPDDLGWRHIVGAGCLGGIGFTMSIFITNLAFVSAPGEINAAKMAILFASVTAGLAGLGWLRAVTRPAPA